MNVKTWRKLKILFFMKSHMDNYILLFLKKIAICLLVTTVHWAVVAGRHIVYQGAKSAFWRDLKIFFQSIFSHGAFVYVTEAALLSKTFPTFFVFELV